MRDELTLFQDFMSKLRSLLDDSALPIYAIIGGLEAMKIDLLTATLKYADKQEEVDD